MSANFDKENRSIANPEEIRFIRSQKNGYYYAFNKIVKYFQIKMYAILQKTLTVSLIQLNEENLT